MRNIKTYRELMEQKDDGMLWAVIDDRTNRIVICDSEEDAWDEQSDMLHEEAVEEFHLLSREEGREYKSEDEMDDAMSDFISYYISDNIFTIGPFDPKDPSDEDTNAAFKTAKESKDPWSIMAIIDRGANPQDHFKSLDELLEIVSRSQRIGSEENKKKIARMWRGRSAFGM